MKLSVCTDAVLHSLPTPEAMAAVNACGINAVEFWAWWNKDIDAVLEAKNSLGLTIAAMCTKFVSLVEPKERPAYIEGLKESIEVAKKLGCKTLITQVGNDLGTERVSQREALIGGLKLCVPYLEQADITLVFEPLNTTVDHSGYYLYSSDEAYAIADEVGSPYVKVLFDIYHQQIMEGDIIRRILKGKGKIGHFHAAGNPGRNELHLGELNYIEIFKAIDEAGIDAYVGLEYFPKEDARAGLMALAV